MRKWPGTSIVSREVVPGSINWEFNATGHEDMIVSCSLGSLVVMQPRHINRVQVSGVVRVHMYEPLTLSDAEDVDLNEMQRSGKFLGFHSMKYERRPMPPIVDDDARCHQLRVTKLRHNGYFKFQYQDIIVFMQPREKSVVVRNAVIDTWINGLPISFGCLEGDTRRHTKAAPRPTEELRLVQIKGPMPNAS